MLLALQEVFWYPDLDMSNSLLNTNYALDVHERAAAPILEYHDAWRHSMSTHVIRLDSGFKLWSGGVTTLMGGDGCALASWCGTSSLWALAKPLAAIGARSSYFGKVCHRLPIWMAGC